MRPASKLCGVCQTRFGDGFCVHMPGAGTKDDPFVPTPVVSDDEDNLVQCGPNGLGAFLPARFREIPAVHLYSILTQAIPYGVHWPLVWDELRYDTDTMFDEENAPSRITFKTAGLYLVTLNVRWQFTDDSAANGVLAAYIRKGGTEFLSNDVFPLPEGSGVGGSGAFNKHSVSALRPFQAGEYVEGLVYQSIKDADDSPRNMRISVERWSPMFEAVLIRQLAGMDIPGVPASE